MKLKSRNHLNGFSPKNISLGKAKHNPHFLLIAAAIAATFSTGVLAQADPSQTISIDLTTNPIEDFYTQISSAQAGDIVQFENSGNFTNSVSSEDANPIITVSGLTIQGSGKSSSALFGTHSAGDFHSILAFAAGVSPESISGLTIGHNTIQETGTDAGGAGIQASGNFSGDIDSVSLTDNSVSSDFEAHGAALYLAQTEASNSDGVFSGQIQNSFISNNHVSSSDANASGGAVYIGRRLTNSISNTAFENNSASSTNGEAYGGAIFVWANASGAFDGTRFANNSVDATSDAFGGAVSIGGDLSSDGIDNSTFENNSVSSSGGTAKGGALRIHSDLSYGANISQSNFVGNIARASGEGSGTGAYGGAIYTGGGISGDIQSAEFRNNSASSVNNLAYGGAIDVGAADDQASDEFTGSIENSLFIGNSASGEGDARGGAIHVVGNFSSTISDSVFSDNSASASNYVYGGAIATEAGAVSNLQIPGTKFFNNSALGNSTNKGKGGAIYSGGDLNLSSFNEDAVFAGNVSGKSSSQAPNAIFLRNSASEASFSAGATDSSNQASTLYFYDPIASGGTLSNLYFNPSWSGDATEWGTVLFDQQESDIEFENAEVDGGTLDLQNGAGLGGDGNTGNLLIDPGATLKIAYDQPSPKRDSTGRVYLKTGASGLEFAQMQTIAYNASLPAAITGSLTIAGNAEFELPAGVTNGNTLLKVSGGVNLGEDSSIIVDLKNHSLLKNQSINLIASQTSLTNASSATFSVLDAQGNIHTTQTRNADGGVMYALSSSGNNLTLTGVDASAPSTNLTWKQPANPATESLWNQTSENWHGTVAAALVDTFLNGDTVSFNTVADDAVQPVGANAIQIDGKGVSVAGMNVTASQGTSDTEATDNSVEFTGGSISIINAGTLTIGVASGNTANMELGDFTNPVEHSTVAPSIFGGTGGTIAFEGTHLPDGTSDSSKLTLLNTADNVIDAGFSGTGTIVKEAGSTGTTTIAQAVDAESAGEPTVSANIQGGELVFADEGNKLASLNIADGKTLGLSAAHLDGTTPALSTKTGFAAGNAPVLDIVGIGEDSSGDGSTTETYKVLTSFAKGEAFSPSDIEKVEGIVLHVAGQAKTGDASIEIPADTDPLYGATVFNQELASDGDFGGFMSMKVVASAVDFEQPTETAYLSIATRLFWNDATKTDYQGAFDIEQGSFELGASLADQSARSEWDGTSLDKTGAGTLVLTGDNSYSGTTTIDAGVLQLGNANYLLSSSTGDGKSTFTGAGAFKIASGATLAIDGAGGGAGVDFSNVIEDKTADDHGSVDIKGSVALTGNNSYTGGTTVEKGATLSIASDNNIGAPAEGYRNVLNDGALTLTGSQPYAQDWTLVGDNTINVQQNGEISGNFSGEGSLVLLGDSYSTVVAFSGADNSYTGETSINLLDLSLTHSLASQKVVVQEFGKLTVAADGVSLGSSADGSSDLEIQGNGTLKFGDSVVSGNASAVLVSGASAPLLTVTGEVIAIGNLSLRKIALNAASADITAEKYLKNLSSVGQSVTLLRAEKGFSINGGVIDASALADAASETRALGLIAANNGIPQLRDQSGNLLTFTRDASSSTVGGYGLDVRHDSTDSANPESLDVRLIALAANTNGDMVWIGAFADGGNYDWSAPASGAGELSDKNWSGLVSGYSLNGTIFINGDNVTFPSGASNKTVTLTNDVTVGNMKVSGAYTFTPKDAETLALRGSLSADIDATDSPMVFNNVIEDGAQGTGGSIVKTGDGELDLNAANTFSGGISVQAGSLKAGNNSALGTGTVALQDGTNLILGEGVNSVSNSFNLSGATTFNAESDSPVVLSGDISGTGSLAKTGEGVMEFTGNVGYTGDTTIGEGEVELSGNASALTSVQLLESAGENPSELSFNYAASSSQRIIALPGISGKGRVSVNIAPDTSGAPGIVEAETIHLDEGSNENDGTLDIEQGEFNIVGNQDAAANLGAENFAEKVIVGKTANGDETAFLGLIPSTQTALNVNSLQIANNGSGINISGIGNIGNINGYLPLIHSDSPIEMEEGGTTTEVSSSDALVITTGNQASLNFLKTSAIFGNNTTQTFSVRGAAESAADLGYTSHDILVRIQPVWYLPPGQEPSGHFTLPAGTGNFYYGVELNDRSATDVANFSPDNDWDGKSLTKDGPDALILTGDNSFTGETNVDEGLLKVTGTLGHENSENQVVNDYAGNIYIEEGAAFDMAPTGGESVVQKLTGRIYGEGGFTVENGKVDITQATADYSGETVVENNGTLYGGIPSGGDLLIGTNGTYVGALDGADKPDISIGMLNSLGTGQAGALDSTGVISNIGTLTVQGGDFAGTIDSSVGKLAVAGMPEAPLTLSGVNAYTGGTDLESGTLALKGEGTLGSERTLTMEEGSTFDLSQSAVAAPLDVLNVEAKGTSIVAPQSQALDLSGTSLNFVLPADISSGDTMTSLTGSANVAGASVNLAVAGNQKLANASGSSSFVVNLIKASEGTISGTPNGKATLTVGTTARYDFNILVSNNALEASLNNPSSGGGKVPVPIPSVKVKGSSISSAKAYTESELSGMNFISMGSDFLAGVGMQSMLTAGKMHSGINAFGAVGGGEVKAKTGSFAKSRGVNMLAGVAYRHGVKTGNVTGGVFFEYGRGNYSNENDGELGTVDGSGDLHYAGGGLMGRAEFGELTATHGYPYIEGSFRAGRVSNEFDVSNMQIAGAANQSAHYDKGTAYMGIHAGAGYMFHLAPRFRMDAYGKVFWNRLSGWKAKVSSGETLDFNAVSSTRARVGARLYYDKGVDISPYVGLAYEYAFGGKAKATSNNGIGSSDIMPAQMHGGSLFGELGLRIHPQSLSSKLSIDLSAAGLAGKRQGVEGALKVRYAF